MVVDAACPDGMDIDSPPSSQEPGREDLLPAALPLVQGSWVTMRWQRPSRVFWGLCVQVWTNPRYRGRTLVTMHRVVFDDGDYGDFDLPSLTTRRSVIHPEEDVPLASRLAVRGTVHATYLGGLSGRTQERAELLLESLADWGDPQWAMVGGRPAAPAPAAPLPAAPLPLPATSPSALPAPPARPSTWLSSLADCSSWWRRDSAPVAMASNPVFEDTPPPPPPLGCAPAPRASSATLRLGSARPTLLRILSSNVGGFSSPAAVMQAVSEWVAADADVIALQETWLTDRAATGLTVPAFCTLVHHATDALRARRYTLLWANDPSATAAGGSHNGVAFLVRASPDVVLGAHSPHASGRLQLLTLRWCGHHLVLVNAYFPSASPAARLAFLRDVLVPALACIPTAASRILMGDFNFTDDPSRDRRPVAPTTAAADAQVSAAFHAACPRLVDLFRSLHPSSPSFTFHRGLRCLARLDRFYSRADVQGYAVACSVLPSGRGDHHAVRLTLRAAQAPERRGRGRRPLPPHLALGAVTAPALAAWATQAAAPVQALTPQQLVAWWPHLARGYADFASGLDRDQRQRRREQEASLHSLQRSLDRAEAAACDAAAPQAEAAARTEAYLHAHAALRATSAAAAPPAPPASAQTRPGRVMTSLLNPPKPPAVIPSLELPCGAVASTNSSIAATLCRTFATVSSHREVDPQAQEAVLAAVRAALTDGSLQRLPRDAAEAAGAAAVQLSEVLEALASTPPSSSPGPSRIPYSLWRVGEGAWGPVLAALFSAIGETGVTPAGFTRGTITCLPKPPAAPHLPSSWRPITLLNAEYRILCKALANRYGRVLAQALGLEQTAFLPGRRIDDSLAFTDLLPHVLLADDVTGAILFLDVAKAFDTIDRGFLYAAMREMGASEGMVSWAMVILHETLASVNANGVESDHLQWHAGVRQGCPLSPLLYLFVAQALASFLRAQPLLGVTVAGVRYVSSHHADDTQVHMGDLSEAATASLSAALDCFGRATGQMVNRDKSKAVLFGRPLPVEACPASIAGIPVVQDVRSLGIPQSAGAALPPRCPPQPSRPNTRAALRPDPAVVAAAAQPPSPFALAAWQSRLQGARIRLRSIAALPLSAMGRGIATSTYATSTLQYFCQFAGVPPEAELRELQAAVARAVCGGASRAFSRPILISRPSEGGVGLLPLEEHTRALHGVAAMRFLRTLLQQPLPPARAPSPQEGELPGPPPSPHPLLLHLPLAEALFATDVAVGGEVVATPVAAPAILPALPLRPGHRGRVPAPWMQLAATLLSACFPTLHPVHAMLAFAYATPANAALGLLGLPRVRQMGRLPPGLLTRMAVAVQALGPFVAQPGPGLPLADARSLVVPLPTHDPFAPCPLSPLLRGACWVQRCFRRPSQEPSVAFAVAQGPLRVADFADFLTRSRHPGRDAIHRVFVGEALGPSASSSARSMAVSAFRATLSRLWSHPCDDSMKEPLWRLAAGAVTGARFRPWRCPCGFAAQHPRPTAATSPSQHSFWTCPVVSVLRAALVAALPGLQRRHVWLVEQPPGASLHTAIWDVVCMAALAAMEMGRAALWADANGQLLPPAAVSELAQRVNLEFWSSLSDYAAWAPPDAHAALPATHPFLRVVAGRLLVAPH